MESRFFMKSSEIPYTAPEIHAVGHGVYFASNVRHAAQQPTEQYATEAMHRSLVLISWTWSYDVEIPRRHQYPLLQRNGTLQIAPDIAPALTTGPNVSVQN